MQNTYLSFICIIAVTGCSGSVVVDSTNGNEGGGSDTSTITTSGSTTTGTSTTTSTSTTTTVTTTSTSTNFSCDVSMPDEAYLEYACMGTEPSACASADEAVNYFWNVYGYEECWEEEDGSYCCSGVSVIDVPCGPESSTNCCYYVELMPYQYCATPV